jgi:hypothetical protein
VVEHLIGNEEVECSIHSGSTTLSPPSKQASDVIASAIADLRAKANSARLVPRIFSLVSKGFAMKYMLTWNERSQGSPIEYEHAQKRILDVFTQWKAPDNFKIEMFVIRVGDWGGYMLLECDDPLAVHKFCSTLPAFEFEARPVIPVMDAVRVELEAMAWRDGLKGK